MSNKEFEFLITSPFDRENLVCEIYYHGELLAEISQEGTEMSIEIYPHENNKWWQISLPKLQNALEAAKKHLLGNR